MTPTVTVIVPAFNRERYIDETIASVLAQTFADFELIVVDDGSTDRTLAIAKAIVDPRLRCLETPHGGIAAAMNAGLRAARGRYVARLDSDDVWLPDLLVTQVAVLDAQPQVGVAYARGQAMEADGRLTTHVWGTAQRFAGDSLRSMLYGDFTCNITTVARRECIEAAGLYDESLHTSEDWDLWLRVSRTHTFAFTDRVLARFRLHEDNITAPTSLQFRRNLEDRIQVLDKFFATPNLPDSVLQMKATAYRNVYTGIGLLWFGMRRYRDAWNAFGQALRVGPSSLVTTLRIGWFILDWNFLSNREWGRHLIDWQSRVRRRWREHRVAIGRGS